MQMRERVVQYLGPNKDTILFTRIDDRRVPIGDNKILIDDSIHKQYAYFTNGKLEIQFDPAKQVTFEELEWWTDKRQYKYYKAYPISVTNPSDSTTIVGYGYNIPIVLEALDKDETWKPVEMRYIYDCGVGLEYVLLKPHEIVCVLAPVYKGDYKTKLRYRLGNNFSKEFVGHISRKQFKFNGKYR